MNDLEFTGAPLFLALANAIQGSLESPAYRALAARPAAAGSGGSLAQQQARMIASAICAASHDELEAFPSFARLRRVIEIQSRNARIVAAFTGHNYANLSARWGLSTRQIRRIVGGSKK